MGEEPVIEIRITRRDQYGNHDYRALIGGEFIDGNLAVLASYIDGVPNSRMRLVGMSGKDKSRVRAYAHPQPEA